jgi:hypothetical protein
MNDQISTFYLNFRLTDLLTEINILVTTLTDIVTVFISMSRIYSLLTKVTPLLKFQVIQMYLHAYSMNEIVKEKPLSKGAVCQIVKDWRTAFACDPPNLVPGVDPSFESVFIRGPGH